MWLHLRVIQLEVDTERVREAIGSLSERRWVAVSFEEEDLPEIAVEVGIVGGRIVITGLVVGAFGVDEIGARDLQDIRLGRVLLDVVEGSGAFDELIREAMIGPQEPAPDYQLPAGRPSGGYPDEHYQWVAHQYRRAVAHSPRNPMAALRESMPGRSDATIRRWIQRARDKGYLGEAVPGRAGEASE